MPELTRQKITLGQMRASGVRGLLIYCSDFQCSHWTAISGDQWPDEIRLSDLEPRFICQACGRRGADVRPNFDWEKEARADVLGPTVFRSTLRMLRRGDIKGRQACAGAPWVVRAEDLAGFAKGKRRKPR